MIKPKALKSGDKIAAVTPSWGGPAVFPHRYEAGKKQFEEAFGLEVVEMPHTLASPDFLAANPEARAADLMAAFSDDSVAGIVATIGGDESIRLLPHIDLELIRSNPKVFMGYSDTGVSHFACFKAGLVSFFGPSFMSGFAENTGMHGYLRNGVRKLLFADSIDLELKPNTEGWTVERLDWANPELQHQARKLNPATPWKYLQGGGVKTGPLIGGTIEVVEFLRGTPVWPEPQQWESAFLFLETSEEAPSPIVVERALRSYAAMGMLQQLSGILFGRPGGQVEPSKFAEYDEAILRVVRDEEKLDDLFVITGMDFGHTDPFLTLPYGIDLEVDFDNQSMRLTECPVEI